MTIDSLRSHLTLRNGLLLAGWLALAAVLLVGASLLRLPAWLPWAIFGALFAVAAAFWLGRRMRRRRASRSLGDMLEKQAAPRADALQRQETDALRQRMLAAISTIRQSKLGQYSGNDALYELPWYMVIGNPAAGKSTAIASSGLQFPLADSKVVQGVGGTRNCDWFFTTDGILLDTAGRYAVADEDRAEWFGFLDLLKKHRSKAPINGVIIAVSVAELANSRPDFAINLAKNLRQRVQEVTERLAVHAPVYIVFTKADLINGFNEFFQDCELGERDRVWGATLPYTPVHQQATSAQLLDLFDARFDELHEGLKDMSRASMALQWRERMPAGVFTFPLEFASIKGPLRTFVATLFEENPFQFKPVFRGFYFTSALQEGETVSASSQRVAQRFDLQLKAPDHGAAHQQQGYFLLNLFRQVIFADKQLVAQYASPARTRMRYAAFIAAMAVAGLALGGWSWSYMNNRQLVANVEADLQQAVRLQDKRVDLQSRLQALGVLQDRIEQLEQYKKDRPLALSLGLYQGQTLDRKLREEYFNGVRAVMLAPVAQALEAFLAEANNADMQPASPPQGAQSTQATAQPFKDAVPGNAEDAYNALKTYLMLGDRTRAEAGHLNDQLTRYWRAWLDANRGAMPREQLIRSAERMISFYLAQVNDTSWPTIDNKLALVDQSRDKLRRVVRGLPARERVYADVKARAATRFPSMTVARIVGDQDKDLLLGSHAVPGSFTREAWEGYVKDAFREAANGAMQSADWVLKSSSKDDLTLEGSPEQIQKSLVELYKTDYAKEWQKFMQGVTIRDLDGFQQAAAAMNRLGDPQISPLNKVVAAVYQQTSWDNPTLVDSGIQQAQRGVAAWFRETILRQTPSSVQAALPAAQGQNPAQNQAQIQALPLGPVGREFAGVARLVAPKDKDASLMRGYMDLLSKLRGRINQIHNQGDAGPGAKQLMQQTLDGNGSELAEALRYVDEQMLVGMSDAQKQALRPLLVRPLMQTFAVIVRPTEEEINKVWSAQVLTPFRRSLALKYPFATESKLEASNAEIGEIFGPSGAIAKFFDATVGPLVVRRGDTLSSRTWANMGINLVPSVATSFPAWVAPLTAGGVANAAASTAGEAQTRFELQALGATGATEFTIEIDGQALRWRGQPQPWVRMVWPNPQGVPGARITAITPEGRSVVVLNEQGHFGLKQMVDASTRKRKDGMFELTWNNGGVSVTANLKVEAPPAPPPAPVPQQASGFKRLRLPDSIVAPAAPTNTVAAAEVQQ